ncbi:MAG: MerR family transcriptional regulator [Bacteriovoracaceae bacterium]|nr:MerR family transcriptional regulator [Bacteriovoracaceae bacterium]
MDKGFVNIPDKEFFGIDEVCSITGVKQYILRFWEKEFPKEVVSENLCTKKGIQNILYIKKLLFDEKMTMDEAVEHVRLNLQTDEDLNCSGWQIESVQEEEDDCYSEMFENLRFARKKLGDVVCFVEHLKDSHHWH